MQEIIENIEKKIKCCLYQISNNSTSDRDIKEAAAVEHLTRAMLNCYEIQKEKSKYERYKELEGIKC